ncbi:MAG: LamG-like jellyroll fold domain-containing protein, partial [Phycisphaerae bacterium]
MRTFTAFLTVSGLVLALAPAALGANGDIAIFSEATGTDVITTAVFDHGWDTTVRTSPAYDLVGGAGGTEIQLIDPGHYLVMYNSRFDSTGGSDRSVMQCNLSLDGNSIPTGWSQGYIRRTQGTDETVASGGGIIDVAANDLLKVQTFRTDTYAAGGVQRAPAASGLQLVKLNDSWSYARLSLSSTQTGPTGETFTDVTYDRQDELDTAVFGHTSGSGDILLKEAGHYLVLANTYLQKAPNTTRTTHAQRLTLDDTEVEGSYTTVYMRGTSTCDEGAAALGMIIETSAADQILNVEIAKDTGTTSDIVPERTAVTIVRLPDDADYIRLTDTDNNVNPASTTAMAWDDEVELDADGFARPTSSQVAAAANDDYLFLTAFEDHTTGEQSYALPYQRWRENDTTIFEYGQSVGYHRATQNSDWAGGWSGLVLGMDSGDYVEVIMDPLSNNTGALTAEHMGLQGVRLGSLFAVALVWDGNDPGAWMSNHWSGITPVGGEDHIVNSGKVEVQSDPPTAGRLTVNGGEVEVQATWTLGVSASVTVNGGTLDVAGLLNAGSLIVAPGGTLELGGTVDANSVTIGGTGTIASTGLLGVAEAMTVEATSLDMNGGALTIGPGGTLTVQNNASLDMNAGTLTTTGATVAVGNDSTPGDTSTLTIDAALVAANLTLRNGGSLVHQGNGVTLTDSLALSGSDLDMTGALLTTTGADVTIGSTLTVDNQTLAAARLDIQGTLVRTGANQNVTITDSLTLGGSDLDMTGALLTTAGAAVTIGAGRNLTVDNQTLEANDLDVQGTLTRTGANQDVTITNSLTLGGDDLDMTGHTLTAAGAALTVESGRTLKTDNTPLAARTVDVSDGGTLDTSGDTDLVLSEALRLPGLSYTLSGGPQFTAAWDNTAGKATQLTLQGGMMTVAAPSLAVPGGAEMYYSFDDPCNPFNDGSAGGSHSATAMGTAPAWTPGGQVNGAVAFDGNDTGLRPADWGFMEDALTEVAIAMWFNQDSNTTGNDTLVDEGGTTNGLGIILDEGVLKATVRTSGTPDADVSSAGALAGWHHMGLVFGRETGLLELYLDGSPVDSNTFGSSTLAAHTDDPGIGFTNAGNPISSGYFWGLMDEFLYYERALTADEMIGLYGGAATADLTGVDVVVTADSGMTLATPTRLGYLTIDGDRTFTLAGEPVSFNSTTLTGSPSAVEIGSSTQAHLTAAAGLDAGGTDVTITKSGAGEIILS